MLFLRKLTCTGNDIRFLFLMRLRKFVLKTEIPDRSTKHSRFHPEERMRTEIIDPHVSWLDTPIEQHTSNDPKQKFKRYSGLTTQPTSTTHHKLSSVSQVNSRKCVDSQRRKTKYNTTSHNQTQIQKIQSHLQSVVGKSKRPTQLHKRMLTLPLGLKSSRRRRDRSAEVPMQWTKYERCCEVIDEIYSKISVLKQIGYSDAKIDFWFLSFCDSRKPFLKHVLMRNINLSLYSLQEEYSYEKERQAVKDMIRYKLRKGKDIFNYIELQQLQEFCRYLQEILIRKNSKKIKEIEESISDKMHLGITNCIKNDYLVFTKEDPKEVYNFTNELTTFEEKFGPFQSFSKINKLRHLELNMLEKTLKNKFKQLVNEEAKEVVRSQATQRDIENLPKVE